MLGKLMKYELQATQRIYLPLYGLILIFAIINKIFLSYNFSGLKSGGVASIPFVITMGIYCILIAALVVMAYVVTIQRFQKNLMGDEGYLSFTLPVRIHSHIDSKTIVTLIWTVLSIVVSVLSIFLLAINKDTAENFAKFLSAVGRFFATYGISAYGVLIEGIVALLISIIVQILQIYAAITVGNLNGKHKLLIGFGAFIGFGVVEQIVGSIVTNAMLGTEHFEIERSVPYTLQLISSYLGIFIGFTLVFGVAFYWLINWLLKNKLNLE